VIIEIRNKDPENIFLEGPAHLNRSRSAHPNSWLSRSFGAYED
jgi:hypothetical protein